MTKVEELKQAIADEKATKELAQAETEYTLARNRWETRQHLENWQAMAFAQAKLELLRGRMGGSS